MGTGMGKRSGTAFPLLQASPVKHDKKNSAGLFRPNTGPEGFVRGFCSGADELPIIRSYVATEANVTLTLQEAARRLNAGGVLLYPTETFFGIGCRADNDEAVQRIFACKKRSLTMPLPVILGSREQLALIACPGQELHDDLASLACFWPGPLTLLLPARKELPETLTGGTGNIAARVSSHPAARALALACGFPIVSSSANISGRPAVTSIIDLDPELLASLDSGTDGILDEAPAPGGGEASTIVQPLGGRRLHVLRKGALPLENLEKVGFTFLTSSPSEAHA